MKRRSATPSRWSVSPTALASTCRARRGRQSPMRKFKLAYDKSYPIGTQDLAPIINEVKALNPDVFIAFSYPPDTLALTEQARIAGFNPKVFYTGVGTAFPLYRAEVRQEHRGRDGHRRLERRQPGDQGLPRPPQGLRRQRRRAGPLGQRGDLCQPADAAAGDRKRRQGRSRRRDQGICRPARSIP